MGESSGLLNKAFEIPVSKAGIESDPSVTGVSISDRAADFQNALLARVEASLTNEVRSLVSALKQFSRRVQCIRKELSVLPDADIFERVPLAFGLMSLQLSDSIEQFVDSGILLKDEGLNISRLLSHLDETFQKVELDGKQFLAIPLCDERGADVLERDCGGDKC